MLSVFPELLFLSPLAPFLLREVLGILLAFAAWSHIQRPDMVSRALATVECAVAIALIVGAWTQVAALATFIVIGIHVALPRLRALSLGTAFLALAMALSLIVTGAGAFALDLPL